MNITNREQKILEIISNESDYIQAKQIASILNLSERTIRNEIVTINNLFDSEPIISKKGHGYFLNPSFNMKDLNDSKPIDDSNRQLLIFKNLLSKGVCNYYDLADEYFISESTLNNDITRLNCEILKRFQAQIKKTNNNVYIDASENLKRDIYTWFLIDEIQKYNFNLEKYKDNFKYSDIIVLKSQIVAFFRNHNLNFNDIEILSLIFHIAILIDRIKSGYSLNVMININDSNPLISEELCESIEKNYDLKLSREERKYLSSLLNARLSNKENVLNYTKLEKLVNNLLEDVYLYYQINLSIDEDLKNNLLIHLASLNERVTNNKYLSNPLVPEIKEKFPLIFDIAVFMSSRIQESLRVELSEDEIGYICLHVMCAVEKMNKEKIRVCLVCQTGHQTTNFLIRKLEYNFPTFISSVAAQSIFDNIDDSNCDLIITTTPNSYKGKKLNVSISPFLYDEDLEKINKALKTARTKKIDKSKIINEQFSEELFFPLMDFSSKKEVITFLCHQLNKKGYCDEDYLSLVMQRENIAPTAFGNMFAIPHPITRAAYRNGIAICTLNKPILWNNNKVRVVIMFSLSKDSVDFNQIYSVLVTLLDDIHRVKKLVKIEDFHAFVNELMDEK